MKKAVLTLAVNVTRRMIEKGWDNRCFPCVCPVAKAVEKAIEKSGKFKDKPQISVGIYTVSIRTETQCFVCNMPHTFYEAYMALMSRGMGVRRAPAAVKAFKGSLIFDSYDR